jgi:hypothetical protein
VSKISVLILSAFLFLSRPVGAETVKNISAEGSCAIVSMSAEQCQLIALQRARAAAIEQAAGMSVASSALVTNMALTADFIKTYSKGFIINEKTQWLPLGQYQKDAKTPPIPEYRVKITADVRTPQPKIKPIGLKAKTNNIVYKNGDRAVIEASAIRVAKIAIFNITADDKVVMVFPNEHDKENRLPAKGRLKFPDKNTKTELVMQTLEGHQRDTEAFLIAALDNEYAKDFTDIFMPLEPMSFSAFFKKFSDIADYAEDVMLVYEVVNPVRNGHSNGVNPKDK